MNIENFIRDAATSLLLPPDVIEEIIYKRKSAHEVAADSKKLEQEKKASPEVKVKAKKSKKSKPYIESDSYVEDASSLDFPLIPDCDPVNIFSIESVKSSIEVWKNQGDDRLRNLQGSFDDALRCAGARFIPRLTRQQRGLSSQLKFSETLVPEVDANLKGLRLKFPNFLEAIDLIDTELRLLSRRDASDFRLPPILLKGEPGVGKSFFAASLAKALGVAYEKVSAGSLQGSFDLNGTNPHFANSFPGQIFFTLAKNIYCSPVFLIDEIDKVAGHQSDPVEPMLLDLLEQDSAKAFRDQCMMIDCDASHIIFIATANYEVSAPLASRFHCIEVPSLTPAQRRDLAYQIFRDFCDSISMDIHADQDLLATIAYSDIRIFTRAIRLAVGNAMRDGRDTLLPSDFSLVSSKKWGIGFAPQKNF